jgi:hypothetical protein
LFPSAGAARASPFNKPVVSTNSMIIPQIGKMMGQIMKVMVISLM